MPCRPKPEHNLTQDPQELIDMLKHGRSEEVQAMIRSMNRSSFPGEFVPFMDQMIREHGITRKQVAVRSGLSQDYVYKLLRGDKHTDERDYLLAMCFAIGMNLTQTQHALSSYGMPGLSKGDLRSHIIILAIVDGASIQTLNDMLEKAGLPLLKTSPDMPSAPIRDTSFPDGDPGKRVRPREFEELGSFVEGTPNDGPAPFDYTYVGWIRVQDKEGNVFVVTALYDGAFSEFDVWTQQQFLELENACAQDGEEPVQEPLETEEDGPGEAPLESYGSLEEAAGSAFFPFFLELDNLTDREVAEVMRKVDDTREYGTRVGMALHGGELPRAYIEMFNDRQPERREYYQMVEYSDGTCRYTASHESCYMRIEMGELYEAYFGQKREPEYFIDSDRDDLSAPERAQVRMIFDMARVLLHDELLKTDAFFRVDPEKHRQEKAEFLGERGSMFLFEGKTEDALSCCRQAMDILTQMGAPENGHLPEYLCGCFRLSRVLDAMNDPEAETWRDRIYDLRERAVRECGAAGNTVPLNTVAETIMMRYARARNSGDDRSARRYVEEALDLIENHHADSVNCVSQFEAHCGMAFYLEDEDLERSLREYRKALCYARDHRMEGNPRVADNLAIVNNNYAWVLWNRCGSEEAVIYYGRAIDLMEGYLSGGTVDRETALSRLQHFGEALNRIYTGTGRLKESRRLEERLAENGVILK